MIHQLPKKNNDPVPSTELPGSVPLNVMSDAARACPLLQALFPAGAFVAQMREPGDPGLLFPAEADCLGRAVPKRMQEFAAGRLCARRALAEFGIVDFPIIAASNRQPIWPGALVGSITHSGGLAAAVAAPKTRIAAIGLDSEVVDAVGRDIWPTICAPSEIGWVQSLPVDGQGPAVAFLFCAKEAFYKCQYPLTGEWLDFHDLCLTPADWGASRVAFSVRPLRRLGIEAYASPPWVGNALFHEHFVTAGVALEAAPAR